jgi:4'-phosphopantetheinyl transferase
MPAAGVVDLWVVPLALSALQDDAALLDAVELERAARLVFERDRHRFVAAHAALRRVLARYAHAEPAALRFAAGDNGKPHLIGPGRSGFGWNLSHSGNLAAVAVAAGAVGVDIECERPLADLPALAERCLTAAESAALDERDAPARVTAFLRAWTRKEACLKALGAGLAVEPRSFAVGLEAVERRVQLQWAGRAHPLIVRSVECADHALLAIALPAPDATVPIVVRRHVLAALPAALP